MALGDWLGFLSNPVGSAISAIGAYQTNKQNAKENQLNREWNEKMWNLNNEYNSPTQVLNRYAEAGIQVNPNYLVTGSYGGGLSSYAGNLDASRSFENPTKGFNVGALEALRYKKDSQVADSTIETNATQQTKNTADANKADKEAKLAEENAKKVIADTTAQDLNNILSASTLYTAIDMAKEQLKAQKKANLISDQEYQNKMKEFEILVQRAIEAQHDAERAEEAVNTQKEQTGLVRAQKVTEGTQQELNRSLSHKAKAETWSAKQQGSYYSELAKTEDYTRLSKDAKNWAEVEQLRSQTGLNEQTCRKLLVDAVIAVKNNEMESYKTYVRDEFGTNVATIMNNHIKVIVNAWNDIGGIHASYKSFMDRYKRK